ncbi:MAG: tail fiber protein [Limnohabitans sp.]|nr:tail fiber protein [Limnohabitans sp.]
MSTEPFIGEIKIFGFNFAPIGYAFCWGQQMSIAQNSALFALLGTTFGGNGVQTFNLPDLRGRLPIGQGSGPGLNSIQMGEMSGVNNITILPSNMPVHNHGLSTVSVKVIASSGIADEASASGNYLATSATNIYSGNGPTPNTFVGSTQVSGATDPSGGSIPMGIMNPYLGLNYCIATTGIFPSRN